MTDLESTSEWGCGRAAKLFYYEDLLQLHRENRPKEVRLGPLLTLHRGILVKRRFPPESAFGFAEILNFA